MRTPSNDAHGVSGAPVAPAEAGAAGSHAPSSPTGAAAPASAGATAAIRSCILTRSRGERGALVRLALAPDGRVLPDIRAKAPGRGAWIGVTRAELATALAKGKLRGALARAFRSNALVVPADLPDLIAAQLERGALDRLGLEAKAGHLLTGSDRIDEAARRGRLHLLAHAADASPDGARKLAQAWRVGSDREGSALQGLALPVPRTTLALALGRENVVHIGLTDRAAAGRVKESLDRWLRFIGPEPGPVPCESGSQGASAPGHYDASVPGSTGPGAKKEDL